jgi:hypothetical protein
VASSAACVHPSQWHVWNIAGQLWQWYVEGEGGWIEGGVEGAGGIKAWPGMQAQAATGCVQWLYTKHMTSKSLMRVFCADILLPCCTAAAAGTGTRGRQLSSLASCSCCPLLATLSVGWSLTLHKVSTDPGGGVGGGGWVGGWVGGSLETQEAAQLMWCN